MIIIEVAGKPAPQGSKRHVGNGRMVEMSKAVGPWRDAVRTQAQLAMDGTLPLEGPLWVRLVFHMPRPKGHYGTGRNAGAVKRSAPAFPVESARDIDKLCRATLDGLTEGGAWGDDGQVVTLLASKRYVVPGGKAGCSIEIAREVP